MKDLLEGASSLFSRRFVLNAFLPVLIVVSLVLLVVSLGSGGSDKIAAVWSQSENVTRVVLLAGWLATIWFLAGLLASQFRNLTQVFEGYPLMRVRIFRPLTNYSIRQHYLRGLALKRAGRIDEFASQYPEKFEHFMPTRLGNVLRSAEMYGHYRYGMDLPLVWPRLATVAPDRYRNDVEEFRTDYEWLLGLSCLASFSAVGLGGYTIVSGGSWWLFVSCFAGGCLVAAAAYSAAITAATEYGEQIRVGVDLYRMEVLKSLGVEPPKGLSAERKLWQRLQAFSKLGEGSPPRQAATSFTTGSVGVAGTEAWPTRRD